MDKDIEKLTLKCLTYILEFKKEKKLQKLIVKYFF